MVGKLALSLARNACATIQLVMGRIYLMFDAW
jgi:hypothetical protein